MEDMLFLFYKEGNVGYREQHTKIQLQLLFTVSRVQPRASYIPRYFNDELLLNNSVIHTVALELPGIMVNTNYNF